MLAGNTYSKSISEYAEPLQPVQPHRYTVQTYQISSENLRMYTHTYRLNILNIYSYMVQIEVCVHKVRYLRYIYMDARKSIVW